MYNRFRWGSEIYQYIQHICRVVDDNSVRKPRVMSLSDYDSFNASPNAFESEEILYIPYQEMKNDSASEIAHHNHSFIREFHKRLEIAIFDNKSYTFKNRLIKPFCNGETDETNPLVNEHNHYMWTDELSIDNIYRMVSHVKEHYYSDNLRICINRDMRYWFHQELRIFYPLGYNTSTKAEADWYRYGHETIGEISGILVDVKPYVPSGFMAAIDFGEPNNRPIAFGTSEDGLSFGMAPVNRTSVCCLAFEGEDYDYIEPY